MMARGWSFGVGENPDRVEVFEDLRRGGVVYLHWRVPGAGGQRRDVLRSMRLTVRDARGRVIAERAEQAKARAREKYQELLGVTTLTSVGVRAISISQGKALAFDPHRGKWPKDKAYRREVARAVANACAVWGPDRTWASLKKSDFRELWRKLFTRYRANGVQGFRATEVTLARLMTLAAWLREEDHIPPVAWLPWKSWRQQVVEDLEEVGEVARVVARPRYTIEELRALLRTAKDVDPRWELLLTLGVGLRLGQVVRAMRNCVELDSGLFDLRKLGRKHKLGAARLLTDGQRETLRRALGPDGYLHALEQQYLEDGTDYPLFYGHALARKGKGRASTTAASKAQRPPLDRATLADFLAANEVLAVVPHLHGRGWTGIRRAMVDYAKMLRVGRDAMKEAGGWADTQMPDRIYADTEQTPAREEARGAFAQMLGEVEGQ